jgi:hypothetical protein
MLAQSCYPEFYDNNAIQYQQVPFFSNRSHSQPFVIHCGHNSVTIYFATLPNDYLAGIACYGSKYLHKLRNAERVTLHRTCKYHMRDPTELVKLLQVLVHLLIHLTSGNAHIGYLFNYDENPLHNLAISSLKSINE